MNEIYFLLDSDNKIITPIIDDKPIKTAIKETLDHYVANDFSLKSIHIFTTTEEFYTNIQLSVNQHTVFTKLVHINKLPAFYLSIYCNEEDNDDWRDS